jgi:hypothetical protein
MFVSINMTSPVDAASFDALRIPPRRSDRPWLRRLVLFVTCVLALDALVGQEGLAQTVRARRERKAAQVALAQIRNENAGLHELIRPDEILFVVNGR